MDDDMRRELRNVASAVRYTSGELEKRLADVEKRLRDVDGTLKVVGGSLTDIRKTLIFEMPKESHAIIIALLLTVIAGMMAYSIWFRG